MTKFKPGDRVLFFYRKKNNDEARLHLGIGSVVKILNKQKLADVDYLFVEVQRDGYDEKILIQSISGHESIVHYDGKQIPEHLGMSHLYYLKNLIQTEEELFKILINIKKGCETECQRICI